jgi:hypothetical protein
MAAIRRGVVLEELPSVPQISPSAELRPDDLTCERGGLREEWFNDQYTSNK